MSTSVDFQGKNRLIRIGVLAGFAAACLADLRPGFVVLVPAYSPTADDQLLEIVDLVVKNGGGEFCFVGPFADDLHNLIDDRLESDGRICIVTTSSAIEGDGVEYFVYGAGAAQCDLLALVHEYPELEQEVVREFLSQSAT